MRRIAILTGGGDCPGLNAVIRAVVKTAQRHHLEVIGIRDGFRGAVEGDFFLLDEAAISGILPRGGTILGTTNRDNPFAFNRVLEDGGKITADRSADVLRNMREQQIDVLVAIGGDGSLRIALQFWRLGLPVVGIPKTIDNDLMCTDQTFGFQTALSVAQEALDRLHTTAESHHRMMVLEVMGRNAGWIALYAGIAGGADVILIPEIPYDIGKVVDAVEERKRQGKRFSIAVVAEAAKPLHGEVVVAQIIKDRPEPVRLGGIGAKFSVDFEALTGIETRVTVLGHLQRGGSPVAEDRILSSRYGVAAVEAVLRGEFGMMVALQGRDIVCAPMADAVAQTKLVTPADAILSVARNLGICFGDG
ncbi:MAG: ATP-dependent 6-phosphofructokinase [Peptococcaceae bacterium]|jgi:6-phosphofructokinase 1|nr:ATP-dependent 6-phosphofructokinase [Peptococcaceae bacterium]